MKGNGAPLVNGLVMGRGLWKLMLKALFILLLLLNLVSQHTTSSKVV